MNVENGIVVRSVAAWLRRRGWIAVPPSGVDGIADVYGGLPISRRAGGGGHE